MFSLDRGDGHISFWKLQLGGWAVYFVMIYITFLTVAAEGNFLYLLGIKGFRALTGFCLTCLLRTAYRRLDPWRSINRTVLLALASAAVFGLCWTAIENLFFWRVSPAFDLAATLARAPRVWLDYAMTLTAWSALYFGVKYWRRWQRERDALLRAETLAKQAQLETLRYQINPHFLFNSLNSLRAVIGEDAARARQMVLRLADFLRYSLSATAAAVPLGEELTAAQNYLSIEKIRFEDRLEVSFDVTDAAREFRVPPFLLNPLIENAIKHGFRNDGRSLSINVVARVDDHSLNLTVANTGELNGHHHHHSANVGLKNVCERLSRLYPGASAFDLREEGGWVRATIRITDGNVQSADR